MGLWSRLAILLHYWKDSENRLVMLRLEGDNKSSTIKYIFVGSTYLAGVIDGSYTRSRTA